MPQGEADNEARQPVFGAPVAKDLALHARREVREAAHEGVLEIAAGDPAKDHQNRRTARPLNVRHSGGRPPQERGRASRR